MLTDRLRAHRSVLPPSGTPRWETYPKPIRWSLGTLRGLSPEWRDVFLYTCSAVFAGVTALAAGIPLYRQWGQMAVGFYVVGAALMTLVAWRVRSRASRTGVAIPPGAVSTPGTPRGWKTARVVAFLIVFLGATVLPLTMEVIWRSEGNAALHVQPEVIVVEQAGVRASHGKDPYQVIDRDGHILIHEDTEPIYELYYPYLPGMVIFGFSSGSKVEARLTDARIQFLVFTILVGVLALSRLRPGTDARYRAFQIFTALPVAALPLATGGDDMPVVALMLLGLAALQRRRPFLAGLALGAASSLKFTSWALVLFALWAAYDLKMHRAVGRYVLGVVAVAGPVVLPVALRNPSAFIDNVVRFPLGLAGVSSPAASALPGHELVSAFPSAHRAYVVAAVVVGTAVVVRHLARRPPRSPSEVATLTGWFMLIAILLAPATRVGYLLYPINLFVWAWMLRRAADPAVAGPAVADPTVPDALGHVLVGTDLARSPTSPVGDQLSSASSNNSIENGVLPAEVVGDTTTPASQ